MQYIISNKRISFYVHIFPGREYYVEHYPQLLSLKCSTLNFKKRNQQFKQKTISRYVSGSNKKKPLKSQDRSKKYPCPAKEPASGRIRTLTYELGLKGPKLEMFGFGFIYINQTCMER
jgi:hypothetical protein